MAKQDLTASLFYDDTWNDITAAGDVYTRESIGITHGCGDEGSAARPGAASAKLRNTAGTYNPRNPTSALYGKAGRNTPARLHMGTPHVGAADSDTSASTSHVAPSVDSPTADGLLICAWSGPFPSGSYTAPGSMTESLDQNDAIQTMMAAREVISASGATGTRTATASASESWLACSVLIHGPSSISTGAIGGSASLTVDGNPGDWWVLFASFGWNDEATPIPDFPWDTDGGGWVLLADTGTINSGDAEAAYNRMKAWAKQVKTTDAAHTVELVDDDIDSTITWLTRVPAADIDSVWSVRANGEVSSWVPGRAVKGDAWTDIVVSGVTRRLGSGKPPVLPAVQRTVFGAGATVSPTAYWPMGGPPALTAGVPAMRVADITGSSSPDLSWITDGSTPVLGDVFSTGGRDIYVRPITSIGIDTTVVADFALRARPTGDSSAFTLSNRVGGTVFFNVVANWATGVPTLTLTSNSGTLDTAASADAARAWNEAAHAWRVTLTQNGADVDVTVHLDGTEIMSGTESSVTLIDAGGFKPGLISAGRADCVLGPLIAWIGTAAPVATIHDAIRGYPGEVAGRRFLRVCREAGVTAACIGDPDNTQPMGGQSAGTLVEVLRDIDSTDDGTIYDAREFRGLAFRTGRSRYNQGSALDLDHDAFELAPVTDPVIDDLNTHNDVTAAQREGGSSARAERTSGPLNVSEPADDPEGVGRTTHRVDVNAFSDGVLPDIAGWHLHRGTIDETRWPSVVVDLDATPSLAGAASAVNVGDRITIENMPADLAPDTLSLIVIGYTETIGSHRRKITYTCIPESQFHIAEVEHDLYVIVGSDGSTVDASFDAGTDTSLDVAVAAGYPLWEFETGFDILVAGVRLSVTAISGSSSPQTFTVDQTPVNGVTKTIAAGERVDLFHKSYIGQ